MSRLPIPRFIQEIKTKLGFDRTMTAPGEDIVDAVNKQSQQIANLGATFWQVVVEGNMFVMYWYGVEAESPISVALEGANYVAYIES